MHPKQLKNGNNQIQLEQCSPYYQALHGRSIRVPKKITQQLYSTIVNQDTEQQRLIRTIEEGTKRAKNLKDPWDGYVAGRPGTAVTQGMDSSVVVSEMLPEDNFSVGTTRLRKLNNEEQPNLASAFSNTNSIMRQYARHSLVSHSQTQRLSGKNQSERLHRETIGRADRRVDPAVISVIERAAVSPLLESANGGQSSMMKSGRKKCNSAQDVILNGRRASSLRQEDLSNSEPTERTARFEANETPFKKFTLPSYPSNAWIPYVPLSHASFEAGSCPSAPDSPCISSLPPLTARAVVAESIARQTTAAIAEDSLRLSVLPPPPDPMNSISGSVQSHGSRKRNSNFVGELDRLELGEFAPSRLETKQGEMSSTKGGSHEDLIRTENESGGGLLSVLVHDHLRKAALAHSSQGRKTNPELGFTGNQLHNVQKRLWRESSTNKYTPVDLSTWHGENKTSSDSVFSSPFFQ